MKLTGEQREALRAWFAKCEERTEHAYLPSLWLEELFGVIEGWPDGAPPCAEPCRVLRGALDVLRATAAGAGEAKRDDNCDVAVRTLEYEAGIREQELVELRSLLAQSPQARRRAKLGADPCTVSMVSSAVCPRGVKGCTQMHGRRGASAVRCSGFHNLGDGACLPFQGTYV